jgi:hypothetical protein
MTLNQGLTTCQTCWHEAVRVDAHGFLHSHTDRHTGRQCRGSGSLARVARPPVRGATRRMVRQGVSAR